MGLLRARLVAPRTVELLGQHPELLGADARAVAIEVPAKAGLTKGLRRDVIVPNTTKDELLATISALQQRDGPLSQRRSRSVPDCGVAEAAGSRASTEPRGFQPEAQCAAPPVPTVVQSGTRNYLSIIMQQPQKQAPKPTKPLRSPAKLSHVVRHSVSEAAPEWSEDFYWLWLASHVTKSKVQSRQEGAGKVYDEAAWPHIQALEREFRETTWPGLRGQRPSWLSR